MLECLSVLLNIFFALWVKTSKLFSIECRMNKTNGATCNQPKIRTANVINQSDLKVKCATGAKRGKTCVEGVVLIFLLIDREYV